MDYLCKILSYDIGRFITDLINALIKTCYQNSGKQKKACKGGSKGVQYPSYTIRHKYPKRLVTYDGEANCEPRLIRFSDLSEIDLEVFKDQCEKEHCQEKKETETCSYRCEHAQKMDTKDDCDVDEDEHDESEEGNENDKEEDQTKDDECEEEEDQAEDDKCEEETEDKFNLINFIMNRINPKSTTDRKLAGQDCKEEARPNEDFFLKLQQQAKALYESRFRCNQVKEQGTLETFWESLSPAYQLRFYWSAYTGEELQSTPFENFSQSYKKDFVQSNPCASMNKFRAEVRRHWACMTRGQRLPFIMQAVIYSISVNDLDPNDHCAVRDLFNKLR